MSKFACPDCGGMTAEDGPSEWGLTVKPDDDDEDLLWLAVDRGVYPHEVH